MRFRKRLAHKAEVLKGSAKKVVGRATGNNRLRLEGRIDRATGNAKQAGDKIKDAFKH